MVVSSRNQNLETAWEHVLVEIFQDPPEQTLARMGPYRQIHTLAGVTDINDFLGLEGGDLQVLEYTIITPQVPITPIQAPADAAAPTAGIPSQKMKYLSLVQLKRIEQVKLWYADYTAQFPALTAARRWHQLTKDMFDEWRSTYSNKPTASATTIAPGSTYSHHTLVDDFNKGIKRSVSDFKVFKDDKYFLTFH
jgi:hypothetical protein